MNAPKTPVKSLLLEELQTKLAGMGQPAYRAAQIMEWIYKKRVRSFETMSNLPRELREALAAEFNFDNLLPANRLGLVRAGDLPGTMLASKETGQEKGQSTRKFLFQLEDGNLIESVLIPASPALYGEASDRRTLCVSTQVGCAYGCKFCASGLDGWTRNLRAGEIVEQILKVEELSGEKINNLVFMGMGEPLANFENLMRAIAIINAPWGIGIGARHITISTSGLAPKIRELVDQPLQIRLAVSLHGATDEVREQIMPVNRKYNVATLMEACDYWTKHKKQKITFEFILISGVNDSESQAAALGKIASRLDAKVNLIPYNTVEGLPWKRPSVRGQEHFLNILKKHRVSATIRREKGHDIEAACGQLRLQAKRSFEAQPTP